jgi:signal transduction histidine kinase
VRGREVTGDRALLRTPFESRRVLAEAVATLTGLSRVGDALDFVQGRVSAILLPRWVEIVCRRPDDPDLRRWAAAGVFETVATGADAERVALLLSAQAPLFVPRPGDLPLPCTPALVAPMVRGDRVFGAIAVGPPGSGDLYRSDAREFLITIAAVAGAVIERGILIDQRGAQERLAAVGYATSALVHDVRHTLAAMKSAAAVLRRRLQQDSRGQELTRIIEAETDRLQDHLLDVLGWVGPVPGEAGPVNLSSVVRAALDAVEPEFRSRNVRVSFPPPDTELHVGGYADRLRRAVMNLLVNAGEALPDGGHVTVRLEPYAHPVTATAGARLVVSDDGPGIGPDIVGRVFEPFFTTKPRGTGLGLANVRRIVEEHGGSIVADNRPEGGARLTVWLPVDPRTLALTSCANP